MQGAVSSPRRHPTQPLLGPMWRKWLKVAAWTLAFLLSAGGNQISHGETFDNSLSLNDPPKTDRPNTDRSLNPQWKSIAIWLNDQGGPVTAKRPAGTLEISQGQRPWKFVKIKPCVPQGTPESEPKPPTRKARRGGAGQGGLGGAQRTSAGCERPSRRQPSAKDPPPEGFPRKQDPTEIPARLVSPVAGGMFAARHSPESLANERGARPSRSHPSASRRRNPVAVFLTLW